MNSKINDERDPLEITNNLKNILTTRTTRSRTQVNNITQKRYCTSQTEKEQNGQKGDQTETGSQNRGEANSKPIDRTSEIQTVESSPVQKQKNANTRMLRTKKITAKSQPVSVIQLLAHQYHLTLFSL